MTYYVYILASKPSGTLYIGSTYQLVKRVWQHKNKFVDGFSKKYGVDKLVYYEEHIDPLGMIKRERRLKQWHRQWQDLYEFICQ